MVKNIFGMWVGENKSAIFWDTILNGLRNHGVQDIFIACTDKLTGISAAIEVFNHQLLKVTKTKTMFPTDDSLLKMLYLAMMGITKNGRVGVRIGAQSMPRWQYIFRIECLINRELHAPQGLDE